MIQWDWFQRYRQRPQAGFTRRAGDLVVQSWDTASSVGEMNDWSVCTTWLVRDNYYVLLDVYRKQLEFPQLRRCVEALAKHWYADLVLIEAVNAGRALCQELRANTELIVLAVVPKDDKRTRMLAESPVIEAGRVYIPEEAPWLPDFQHEIVRFPNGKYDDQVDSLSQFLYWARVKPRRPPTFRSRITLC